MDEKNRHYIRIAYYGSTYEKNCYVLPNFSLAREVETPEGLQETVNHNIIRDEDEYNIMIRIVAKMTSDENHIEVLPTRLNVDVILHVFDGESSNFMNIFLLRKFYPNVPILLVCDIDDSKTEFKEFLKCLAYLVGDVIFLEYRDNTIKQTGNSIFQRRLESSIISLYERANDNIGDIDSKKLTIMNKDKISKDVQINHLSELTLGMEKCLHMFDHFLLRFALKLGFLPRGCTGWYIAGSSDPVNSGNSVGNSPGKSLEKGVEGISMIKCQSADDPKTLCKIICNPENVDHSLRFVAQNCSSVEKSIGTLHLHERASRIKRLMIISCMGKLSLKFLSTLPKGLEYLVIVNTNVDLSSVTFPPAIAFTLKTLVLRNCDTETEEVPPVIGRLVNLEVLDITENRFTKLPNSLGNLRRPSSIKVDKDEIRYPPLTVLRKSPQDIIKYLKVLQEEEPAPNKEAKVMVVGQERVGKSTLVKSLKQRGFRLWKTTPPPKTDGIDISTLPLKETDCKVYDLAGDVEFLNTHALFFSPHALHLAVFDLSQFTVSKEMRSTDHLCRLELWLQTIACQDLKSYAIIVGTHSDHNMLSPEVLTRIHRCLYELLQKFQLKHQNVNTSSLNDNCMLCYPDELLKDITSSVVEVPPIDSQCNGDVPHILGYFEVSGITNKNVKKLKIKIGSATAEIKRSTNTDCVPKKWIILRQTLLKKVVNDDNLRKQPILQLESVRQFALEVDIVNEDSIVAMLRFFHSQGDFLWYEDLPEMKEVVILDPQWLSDQLRSLITHQPDVNVLFDGVLHHSELPKLWCDMSQENRTRLINLFRSVGLCFSISEEEDLFPCKLPVGWPDREMWPPFPEPDENQTSILFLFSFVPPSFFPDLIIAIDKKRDYFPANVKPLYYRFNVVYITKHHGECDVHATHEQIDNSSETGELPSTFHRVHIELMPYRNSLKVIIRGPSPCFQLHDIRSSIEMVKSRRYPGITYKELLICPVCELKRTQNPSTLDYNDSHEEFCPKGHQIGSISNILRGKWNPSSVTTSNVVQTSRVMGETLEEHFCPKLFAVLPINLNSLSLKDRLVYSYLRDGYAVHLLCECPDEWHFLSSPGFRVGKPKEFFKAYGGRVCKVLRVFSVLGAPFKAASALDPHCKAGVAAANAAKTISSELKVLLENYLDKYPHLKASLGSPTDDLKDLRSSRGLLRSELARFLEVAANGRDFGPLTCTYVDKYNEWLWLCEEHNQKYEIVERRE